MSDDFLDPLSNPEAFSEPAPATSASVSAAPDSFDFANEWSIAKDHMSKEKKVAVCLLFMFVYFFSVDLTLSF